ncbi:MAG: glutathione S-transferase [Gammaproteobacteria bacterium]|jgi:glutathione S-transferase|nr:glutathione S-transferase [Gammaproteobacteria bacterium]
MIRLYQFAPCWNLPSASPFCVKLETYLRIANIPHETVILSDPRKAPKGKLPFIEDKGKKIADSSLIIEYIKQTYGDKVDAHLTNEQKSVALAFQRMVEEHLYWVLVYNRWIDADGWALTKETYFSFMPKLIRKFVPDLIRKGMIKTINNQGLGRHSKEEVYQMGCDDVKAIAEFLGNKNYFFNDKVSSLDAIVYAFIASILYAPIDSPMKRYIKNSPNLLAFCENIKSQYYS